MAMPQRIEEKTREIAKRYGCDRAVWARCWMKKCPCRVEARKELEQEWRDERAKNTG